MGIQENLRARRVGKGWSQADLAVRTGLSARYGYLQVSAWEVGRQKPSAKNLIRLSDALGATVDELIGGTVPTRTDVCESIPGSESGEVWADVPGYVGLYKVSSHGRLLALPGVRPSGGGKRSAFTRVKQADAAGRLRHTLFKDGKANRVLVAHLVLTVFRGPPPGRTGLHDDEFSSNHINGDWLDNRVENLEWISNPDHRQHTVRNGLHAHHESHRKAKLTWTAVHSIRQSGESTVALARRFGVAPSTIRAVRNNVTWRDHARV